ncbi:MAG: hypothetical protein AMXMBFR23_09330 [Chloroflexota bacterium]
MARTVPPRFDTIPDARSRQRRAAGGRMNTRARLRRPTGADASSPERPQPVQRSLAPGAASLLRLQGAAGNRAVQRQVREGLVQRGGPADDEYTPYQPMPAAPASQPPGYGQYQVSPHLPPAPASDTNYGPMPSGPGGAASATATATPTASASAAASPGPGPARDAGYGPMPASPLGAASATATATPMPAPSASASQPPGYGEYRVSPHLPAGPGGDDSYTAYQPMPGRPSAAAPAPDGPLAPGPGPGPDRPAPLKLPAKYADEDKKFGWRAFYGTDPATMSPEERAARERAAAGTNVITKYNTAEETAANTLTPSAGPDGAKALTTATGEKASMRPVEYAMGTGGQIVANLGGRKSNMLPTGQKQTIHHSTMMAGADVAHAGHIGMQEGQVNYLDDDSGHYRPTEAHTFDAFNRLADSGVLNPNSATGRVNLVDKKGTKGVDRGASASVHFSGYQQSQGNEAGIRSKAAMLNELQQKVPRYEPAEAPAPAPAPAPDDALAFDDAAPAAPAAPAPAPAPAPADPSYNVSPHDPSATPVAPSPVAPRQPTPVAPAAPAMSPGPMGPEYQVSPHLPPAPAENPEYQVSPHLPPEAAAAAEAVPPASNVVSVPGYDPYRVSPH